MKGLQKSITLIFLSLAFASNTLAQETKTYAGFDIGVNISMPNVEELETSENTNKKNKSNFFFRFNVTHEFTENIFLKTGVGYIPYQIEHSLLSDISLKYLELPLQIGYKIPISYDTNLGISGGPYFGWGVGGKIKEEHDTFGKNGLDIFNYGAGISIGLELQKIAINIGYNHGIKDISGSYADRAIRLRNFYGTIGFNF